MGLNWILEGNIELVSSLPTFYSFSVLIREYMKFRDRALFFLSMGWFFFGLIYIFNFLSYLFLSIFLFQIRTVFLMIMAMSLVYAIQIMISENINTPIFSTFMSISIFTVYTAFLEGSVIDFYWTNGDQSFAAVGIYRIFFILTSLMIVFSYGVYAVLLYYNAPPKLKKHALMHLYGFIIMGPIGLLLFILKVNWIIPSIQSVVFAVGVTITAVTIADNPQLLYVLPFKAHKLVVIEKHSGVTIFSYNWSDLEFNVSDPLFSSALESMSSFLSETTNKGRLREIQLERATLLINEPLGKFYTVVLVEGKTHSMKEGLERFSKLFTDIFGHLIDGVSLIQNELFDSANDLIQYCFPYVPHFK